jgi:hypothetical protein
MTLVTTAGSMPSARYFRQQAKALLARANAANDKAYASRLRARAAEELERAQEAREEVSDLNALLTEFNDKQMRADS